MKSTRAITSCKSISLMIIEGTSLITVSSNPGTLRTTIRRSYRKGSGRKQTMLLQRGMKKVPGTLDCFQRRRKTIRTKTNSTAHAAATGFITGKPRPAHSILFTAPKKTRSMERTAKGSAFRRRLLSPGGRSQRTFSFPLIRTSQSKTSTAM